MSMSQADFVVFVTLVQLAEEALDAWLAAGKPASGPIYNRMVSTTRDEVRYEARFEETALAAAEERMEAECGR